MKKLIDQRAGSTIALAELCRRLPARLVWMVSSVVGTVLYATGGRRRRQVRKSYEQLCKMLEVKQSPEELTKRFFQIQFMLLVSQYILLGVDRRRWDELVRVEGEEHVRDALKQGRGLILTLVHFGSDLLSLCALENNGYHVAPMRPAIMDRIASERVRRMLFMHGEGVYVGDVKGLSAPLRKAVRLLKENRIVAIAIDGNIGEKVTEAPFLRRALPIRPGALRLAQLNKSPMLFTSAVISDGRLLVRFYPPTFFDDETDPTETTNSFLERCMRDYEDAVREFPECAWWTPPFNYAVGLRKELPDAPSGEAKLIRKGAQVSTESDDF